MGLLDAPVDKREPEFSDHVANWQQAFTAWRGMSTYIFIYKKETCFHFQKAYILLQETRDKANADALRLPTGVLCFFWASIANLSASNHSRRPTCENPIRVAHPSHPLLHRALAVANGLGGAAPPDEEHGKQRDDDTKQQQQADD